MLSKQRADKSHHLDYLIEYEPVPVGTLLNVLLHCCGVGTALEVSVHP